MPSAALKRPKSPVKNTVLAFIVILVFTGAIAGIIYIWGELGVHLSFHGWMAYALGGLASLGLTAGLFFLTFKSAREGYDDIARPEDPSE